MALTRGKLVTLAVVGFSAVVGGLWSLGPLVYAGRDDPTAIDSRPVRQAVVGACQQLRAQLAAIPKGTGADARAEAENRAVEALVGRVRVLGPAVLTKDQPVERWLADWETLVAARRRALREGAPFAVPEEAGTPVNLRMFALVKSGLRDCDVPIQLLAPRPGA